MISLATFVRLTQDHEPIDRLTEPGKAAANDSLRLQDLISSLSYAGKIRKPEAQNRD